jgi:hypothetical protein
MDKYVKLDDVLRTLDNCLDIDQNNYLPVDERPFNYELLVKTIKELPFVLGIDDGM